MTKNQESSNNLNNELTDIAMAQLVLAEKRTVLAVIRIGIAVLALPLSVVTALITLSKYYDVMNNLPMLIPLLSICVGLVVFGVWLFGRSMRKLRHQEEILTKIKEADPILREILK